jgi:hypothetical protein
LLNWYAMAHARELFERGVRASKVP